jgi:hypothetical protein
MGLAGAIERITGHVRLTGPFSEAERRRNLRMDVTTCTLFSARCHNHDIPAERPAGPAVPSPVTPEGGRAGDHAEKAASILSRLGRMPEPMRDIDNTSIRRKATLIAWPCAGPRGPAEPVPQRSR